MSITANLKALGNSAHNSYIHQKVTPSLLECFDNPVTVKGTASITITAPEFTSLCPLTNQPDFATIVVIYQPAAKCVESKSLKLYLGSYRNAGVFHEDCCNRIAKDLIDLLDPLVLEVNGIFTPRGGIAFHPHILYTRKQN